MRNSFAKEFKRELTGYFRSVWPYALALVLISVAAGLVILYDENPYESTGLITAIGFFVLAVLAFIVGGYIYAYRSFSKNLSIENTENLHSLYMQLGARFTAFFVYIFIAEALIFACVAIVANQSAGQIFSALVADYSCSILFLSGIIVIAVTVYIIPNVCIVIWRYGRFKAFALIAGIITLIACFILIVQEACLLVRSPSTDMPFLSTFLITLLSVIILVDIGACASAHRTLKFAFNKKPPLKK